VSGPLDLYTSSPIVDELSSAQARLARAVARARAGEDRELTLKVRQAGEGLAGVLARLLRLIRLHEADNRAFDVLLEELSGAVGHLVDLLGSVNLVTVEDQIYVNDVRVRVELMVGVKDLDSDLARHDAGGLTFHAREPAEALRPIVHGFAAEPAKVGPRRALQTALHAAGLRTVDVAPRLRFLDRGEVHAEVGPVDALRRVVRLMQQTYDEAAQGRPINVLALRRSVARILEVGPETPGLWEALGGGAPHAWHAAAAAMVSLLIGKTAGLRTGLLHDLGLAALVHDIGYAFIPADVARGMEGLIRHPGEGARILLRQRGFHVAKLRRLRAVLDHHRDHAEPRGHPSAVGEVLRLAEDYTTMLRVFRRRISPADALGAMWQAAGSYYHPELTQAMVNALGRNPPGTLLELDDGRVARCVSPVRSPETFAAPLVRIFDHRTGKLAGDRIDLALGGAIRRVLPG
jgi:hypothetical protein